MNGSEVASYSKTQEGEGSRETDAAQNLGIGSFVSGKRTQDGPIDEVRISDVVRSACWIETEYNNQDDPAKNRSCTDDGFICLGSEE